MLFVVVVVLALSLIWKIDFFWKVFIILNENVMAKRGSKVHYENIDKERTVFIKEI